MEIKAATYELPNGEQQVVITRNGQEQRFSASELSEFLQILSSIREGLQPPVRTSDPQLGDEVQATLDPRWALHPESFVGGASFHIRHPGLGWLAFAFPLQSLRQLASATQSVLATAEQNEASSSKN